jgi:streptogramin lyase
MLYSLRSRDRRLLLTTFRISFVLLLFATTRARAQTITEYPVPTPASVPFDITAGPDGNLWFTEFTPGIRTIGRITPEGAITEFPLPANPANGPFGIAAGPDGNLWFTLSPLADLPGNSAIGRITTGGVAATDVPLPDGSAPLGIAAGPDGNLWFVLAGTNAIGRVTTSGVVTQFTIPTALSSPAAIAAGADGNLWFTELDANKIGRITTSGVFTEFPIPTPGSQPAEITAGPDGAIWFNELAANQIGRITSSGIISEFPVPTPNAFPEGGEIAAGLDGNLWFTENSANKIGRITTSGVVTEFAVPTANSGPSAIAKGPDGNIWFTEELGNNIGRITTGPAGPCVADGHTLCLNNDRFSITASFRATSTSPTAPATAVELTGDSGYFWFFGPNNVELVVKVLNACVDPFDSYWFFAAGLTDVEVEITVVDRHTFQSKIYRSERGTPFAPIQDTAAFSTCP